MRKTDQQLEDQIVELKLKGMKHRDISQAVYGTRSKASTVHYVLARRGLLGGGVKSLSEGRSGPRIVTIDIETAPMMGAIWSQWQKFVSLDMIHTDWYIMSWTAKWLDEKDTIYRDIRDNYDSESDASIIGDLWEILDKADIVITQNGDKFDLRKINTRFLANGLRQPSPYKSVDILKINKRVFGHTSNKLEYIADKFNIKFKKLDHANYAGYKLWKACLAGNMRAWDEMELYNRHDVLSTEEYYIRVAAWDNKHPNVNLYSEALDIRCTCGACDWVRDGYARTNLSVFEQYRCKKCGAFQRGRTNLLSKEKRKTLRMNIL